MGKTVLGFLGSRLIVASLIAASMASAVTATEHHIRRHHPQLSESARHAFGWYQHPEAFNPAYDNAFGTISPMEWTTGMQPDDWRQSVNGR
jgi:hypothetical protein